MTHETLYQKHLAADWRVTHVSAKKHGQITLNFVIKELQRVGGQEGRIKELLLEKDKLEMK